VFGWTNKRGETYVNISPILLVVTIDLSKKIVCLPFEGEMLKTLSINVLIKQ